MLQKRDSRKGKLHPTPGISYTKEHHQLKKKGCCFTGKTSSCMKSNLINLFYFIIGNYLHVLKFSEAKNLLYYLDYKTPWAGYYTRKGGKVCWVCFLKALLHSLPERQMANEITYQYKKTKKTPK